MIIGCLGSIDEDSLRNPVNFGGPHMQECMAAVVSCVAMLHSSIISLYSVNHIRTICDSM
jgi:hypothetical protein